MFNPLEHPGIPLASQARYWRELNAAPIHPRACEPGTRCRIITMMGIEDAGIRFDRLVSRTEPDPTLRTALARLRSAETRQRRALVGLLPQPETVLETALTYELAAVEIDVWLARTEPEPPRRQVYQCDALEDFDHAYRYAAAVDLLGRRGSAQLVDELAGALPDRSGRRPPGSGWEEPGGSVGPSPLSALNALTLLAVEQQMTDFYDRADSQLLDPPGRAVFREVSRVEREQVGRHRFLLDSVGGRWEQLIMREYNECRLYHAFLRHETDPRVRAVWELDLELELGHLRAARELLRRFSGREAEELVGTALPEPLGFDQNREYLRRLLATHLDPDTLGSRAIREVPQVREVRAGMDTRRAAEPGTDVVDVAIAQHSRIEALFYEIEVAPHHRRQAPFDDLVRLIADHETAEQDTIHRLTRDRIPGGFDMVRDLVEEESAVRQMLPGLIDAGVDGPDFDDGLSTLRDAFLSHAGHEERYEFRRLRERLRPADPQATPGGRRP